jgi:hypothetical protein
LSPPLFIVSRIGSAFSFRKHLCCGPVCGSPSVPSMQLNEPIQASVEVRYTACSFDDPRRQFGALRLFTLRGRPFHTSPQPGSFFTPLSFCTPRFGQHNMQNQLSLWLRPYLRRYSKFGEASFTLTQFFRDQAATAAPVAPRAETGPFGGVKKRLRPEESGGEVEVEGGGGGNGRRARPHIEVSFEELAGNAGFTSGEVSGRWGCPS